MKLAPLVTLVILGIGIASAQQMSARVSVYSDADVVDLYRQGIVLSDARIHERLGFDGIKHCRPVYCPENGFVTIIGVQGEIDLLRSKGCHVFDVREIHRGRDLSRTSEKLDTIPYQFGWPRLIVNGNSLYENSPTVADIDRNGQLDISVTNAWGSYSPPNPPYIIVWRRNGAYVSGFPVALQPGQLQSSADAGISAMADIYGDSKLEIVCGDENGYLYAFNYDGSPLSGFPVNYGSGMGVYAPALADVDNDGKSEIAVISHEWDSPYGNALLHLLKISSNGPQEVPGFPVNLERGAENSPSIGDLDGDGQMEIVVCTGGSSDGSVLAKVIAYTATGHVKPGFPWIVGRNSAGCNPTLYDINGDGTLEILIRVKPDYNNINGIYAIKSNGTVAPGFPFPITYGNPNACVAVGDMTGDGIPEIAYGGVEAVDSGKVWAFSLDGALVPGFPGRVYRTWVDGSVAIADVDGDGKGDVVCGTNGVSSEPGLICAFNYLGQVVQGFPFSPGNPLLNSFTTHPTLVDIDGDGDTEIFAGRVDKFVYGWDTPGLFDSTSAWTTFKGNAARTGGQLRSPFLVGVKEGGKMPSGLSLDQNYPNPFNPSTTIQIALPGETGFTLTIFDILGRKVRTFDNSLAVAGVHEVTWDGKDATGQDVSSGVFIYRVEAGGLALSKTMMLLK